MMSLIVTLPNAPTSAESFASGRIADGVSAAAPPSVPVVHEIRAQSTTVFTFVIALRRMPARRAASRSTLAIGTDPIGTLAMGTLAIGTEPMGTEAIGTPAMPMPATVFVAVFTPAHEPPAFWIAAHQLEAPGGGICESVSVAEQDRGEREAAEDRAGKAALGEGQGLELPLPRGVRVDVGERQGLDRDVRPEQLRPVDRQTPTAGSRPGRPSRSARPRARRSRSGRSRSGPRRSEPRRSGRSRSGRSRWARCRSGRCRSGRSRSGSSRRARCRESRRRPAAASRAPRTAARAVRPRAGRAGRS